MTELLAPVGSEQAAVAALTSGADALYLGVGSFSARKEANFDGETFARIVRLAHLMGARVYVALNTLVKDSETEAFFARAREVWNGGADAILIQDLFLGRELRRLYPEMTLHLSTQAGCCNRLGAEIAKEYGFSRAVLAREVPISDMGTISEVIETEVFVQGALCTAFSGQCYFSSFAGGHSGNRGMCKQPCRKRYAIDRAGFEEPAYALSTSDLSVGERVGELLAAGVSSLKIEGRLRRPEYVGAAVKYYRALLDGKPAGEAFSALRRTYNRGDYTAGLAFGQREDFLSRDVQGHIGERVGSVEFVKGRPFVHTSPDIERGDGFKILRRGKEVGGAVATECREGGVVLSSSKKLAAGDEARVTTSAAATRFALEPTRTRTLQVHLRMMTGEYPEARTEGLIVRGEEVLAPARNAPLTEEELSDCFSKTDGLPLTVEVTAETDGVFLPRSALNAFRRKFYAALTEEKRVPLEERTPRMVSLSPVRGERTACIGQGEADILIHKPRDYTKAERPAGKCVYLYLPPYLNEADLAAVRPALGKFDGIYCEGYYGIALAREVGLPLFAGTGFHLTNRYGVEGALEAARYAALSKEISRREQDALAAQNTFALTRGAVKLMDLGYCIFGRTCAQCDRRPLYRMTDDAGRTFFLSRYRTADMGCRFEVYNCAALETERGLASPLFDASIPAPREKTSGHAVRSML